MRPAATPGQAMAQHLAESDLLEFTPKELAPPFMIVWTCGFCGMEQATVELTKGNELVPNPRRVCCECGNPAEKKEE